MTALPHLVKEPNIVFAKTCPHLISPHAYGGLSCEHRHLLTGLEDAVENSAAVPAVCGLSEWDRRAQMLRTNREVSL